MNNHHWCACLQNTEWYQHARNAAGSLELLGGVDPFVSAPGRLALADRGINDTWGLATGGCVLITPYTLIAQYACNELFVRATCILEGACFSPVLMSPNPKRSHEPSVALAHM
jgi:hypothetical protein